MHWMPEACYDPVRLKYHGWKKWLVGPIERFSLRRAKVIVATCEAEKGWIEAYLARKCPAVEVTDIKRFFDLSHKGHKEGEPLHLLYLGRRHPLKGLEYLEAAVAALNEELIMKNEEFPAIEFKVASNAFGEEKKRVWEWCDVLVLPTLSDNFGLVIAEALERGKRVITTDGAPAWEPEECEIVELWNCGNLKIWKCMKERMFYLKGYRDGTNEERVRLLRKAIEELACRS